MKNIKRTFIPLFVATILVTNGCALLRSGPKSFDATPKAVSGELRYITLHTDKTLPLKEGTRYSVRRLSDDVEMSDLILKSINGKVLLTDVLWSGWEPAFESDATVRLTYKYE